MKPTGFLNDDMGAMTSNATSIYRLPDIKIRRIALPTEHGGWGILLEPIVAGLAIAFSISGVWIAVMMIGAFLTRQPLKVLVLDRLGASDDRRAFVAGQFVALYAIVSITGLAATIATTGFGPIFPLLALLPVGTVQIYFDLFRRSRDLTAELSGVAAISISIMAIATAGSMSYSVAAALWLIFITRLVPSVLYVRERLLLEKGKKVLQILPIIAHVVAVIVVAVFSYYHLASILTVIVSAFLLVRCVNGLSAGRKKMKAMLIGIREVVYGVAFVISVIVGHFVGF